MRHWRTTDGLPQNSVNSLAQTPDGYLWIGTYDGLARFDGRRIEVFSRHSQHALPSDRVVALHADDAGSLWLATDDGDVYRRTREGFEAVPLPPNQRRGRIMAIDSDDRGDVWLLDREGMLTRVRDAHTVPGPVRERVPRGPTTLARDVRTRQLYLLHLGVVARLHAGSLEVIPVSEDPQTDARMIGSDQRGGIWVATTRRLRRLQGGTWSPDDRPLVYSQEGISALVAQADGTIVLATVSDGIHMLDRDGNQRHFGAHNDLDDNWVRCLLLDRGGTLWAGTSIAGLTAIQGTGFQLLAPPREWGLRPLKSVTPHRGGGVWAGSEGSGLYRYWDGTWTRFGAEIGLSNPFVWSVREDAEGRVWTGTWGGGLFLFDGAEFKRVPGLEDPTASVASILPARDGSMWIGTTAGLWRRTAAGAIERFGPDQTIGHGDVRVMAESPDGTIWFGLMGGGLGQWREGRITLVPLPADQARMVISALHADERGVLWIGSLSGGLSRYDGRALFSYGPDHGIGQDTVTHIDGETEFIWLSTTRAITRFVRAELDTVADGTTARARGTAFGTGAEAATSPRAIGAQPTGCRTEDGMLWFASSDGLVRLDPTFSDTHTVPLPIIEQISIDDVRLTPPAPDAGPAKVIVPAGSERVEFQFTAPEFQAAESLRFRYRLRGDDRSWMEAGRERTANYHRLPPGDYVFEVEVTGPGPGVRQVEQPFAVLPLFWQRTSVQSTAYAFSVLAIAGLVYLQARVVHRRREREMRRHQALERERARIARDIHDDLGASLTRISLMTQSAQRDISRSEDAAPRLEQIVKTARQLTHKMDEIVWAVSPRHDSLESVAHYLASFAQEHLGAAEISCRLDVPMTLPHRAVYAETRHHLFLAFQEAIHNVIKHAGATRVLVVLRTEATSFVVSVEDNGRGMPPASEASAQRSGVDNMKRRLAEVGGGCQIEALPAGGTRVTFDVPYNRPGDLHS